MGVDVPGILAFGAHLLGGVFVMLDLARSGRVFLRMPIEAYPGWLGV
jgi:hypothetical protein